MSDSNKNANKIAANLSQMIQVKTISHKAPSKMDMASFEAFKSLLESLYPSIHKGCERSYHGPTGILYKWQGKNNHDPIVLMSHYDVVPCDEALWTVAPFSGQIDEAFVWGRGTLDTKGTLCGILEAVETLILEGHEPERDIYLSFSGDEEISGPSAPAIVAHLTSKGVKPALVLDEGGAIVEGIFPGVSGPIAVVGTGEKGYLDVLLRMKGKGGHSSAPPAHSLVGELSKAVVKLEKRPFKARLTPPVKEMFETLGKKSTPLYRVLFSNLWLFKPLLVKFFTRKGGEMNAMIRTTTAVTKMSASKAFNVLPPYAEVGINFRLLPGDTVESALAYIEKVVDNPEIEVQCVTSREASAVSKTYGFGWEAVNKAILATWQDVIVTPYLMMAATDSRHYCSLSEHVFRFSAMPLSNEERALIHSNDERIRIETLVGIVSFYEQLLRHL